MDFLLPGVRRAVDLIPPTAEFVAGHRHALPLSVAAAARERKGGGIQLLLVLVSPARDGYRITNVPAVKPGLPLHLLV